MADTQPRTFRLSPSALLSFPSRFCNPPPSVGKVRSCSATAVVDVKLDDILERKHLPPLGLKDFEEWLLFVEQSAENLYFILWIKEYNARYTQWMNNTRALLKNDPYHPYQSTSQLPPSTQTNRSLAIFYSRAKQTFFTPNSPYELDLPSDILGPFHTPTLSSDSLNHPPNHDHSVSSGALSPHPNPAVFSEVEDKVRSMLQESLDRFANSTITNVGTARATCGLVGGTVIALAGFLPPIAENLALSKNRWLRVLAFPGLWLGLTIVLASLRGVCMMIYVFGDLRQLRSFELARPPISPPQRLRPLRINTAPVRSPPPEPEPWSIPIRRPPIIPKPVHDPEKSFTPPVSPNAIRFLPPNHEPVQSPLSYRSSNTRLQVDDTNPRVTVSSVRADSPTSYDSDASRTSTTSSEVEIHISEAFQDIEPPYLRDDLMTSSPVPSSWQAESPSNTPPAWIPHLMAYNADSVLPSSPASQRFPSPADNVFRASNARTSTTLDREEEREKWMPTASFIQPFEYNEWEEWDGESVICVTEGSLGGYGGGDEESRISHFVHPTSFGQNGSRGIGARVPTQLRGGSRRGTITSTKGSEQFGTFDFNALPAFQAAASPSVAPAFQRKPRYRACDVSPLPPLQEETGLMEAGRQGDALRSWFVEVPKLVIRRTQGKCAAAKQVMKDVLSRSANEASRRNGGGGGSGGTYLDTPKAEDGQQRFTVAGGVYPDRGLDDLTVSTTPRPLPNSHHTVSKAKEKGKFDVKQTKESWRVRWKRVLSVPAFRSPLTKILNPVVTRAQWEVVVRSGILAFVISFVIVAIIVAVPVP
ncbi:hypothetical protein BDM02DRAFT_417328 [Thelephora ganbajun]|uniref:Uncharacterized protein n=1 Tax=Thelephora ganbajun TaxID=370292 RepID=A0ACB6Z7N2_THEGA|nr:hypothetical protein BDM02DRAFT_417328 [Thelephora ganbajun]